MAAEQRTDADIRSEIAVERDQLETALADLREGIAAKRRIATAIGTLVATGVAAVVSVKVARRFRGD